MAGTTILRCDCKNTFQDKTYGKGMRVHNIGVNKNRCTGCGKTR